MNITLEELAPLASVHGLEVMGVLNASEAAALLRDSSKRLAEWQDQGNAGSMEYMLRPPELFADLPHFLENCGSVVSFFIPYLQQTLGTAEHHVPAPPAGYGRVARYAWGRDYHKVIPKLLKALVRDVEAHLGVPGKIQSRVFTDAVPILERTLAAGANLGFIGKNTMLIRPGSGSFAFLAEILWNVEIAATDHQRTRHPKMAAGSGCGSCSRCLSQCPTGALPEPGKLDARRCISYLTIEKRGCFSEWEAAAVGDWLFGCDICQEVCPFNHRGVQATKSKEFLARATQAPYISLSDLLEIRRREDFLSRFQGTAIMRAGWEQMQRNACAVVGNTKYLPALPQLQWLWQNSESDLVREASLHALAKF